MESSKATSKSVSETAAQPQPTLWEIDAAHSYAHFSVRHMMVSNVRGGFGRVDGFVELNGQDPTRSKVEATIGADSINTREAQRDEHLKSADFLDVAKYPIISFRSTQITKSEDGGWQLVGDLTIHGVTRPVTLNVEALTPAIPDPWGKIRMGTSATTKINRRDFGLNWNAALEAGGLLVGNDVSITIDVELVKKSGC
jgi:polyisoprenoid-binding protein YceI